MSRGQQHYAASLSPARIRRLEELEELRKQANQAVMDFKKDCLVEAPAKIGDRIRVTDFAHNGKIMEITVIFLSSQRRGSLAWAAKGFVVKANGQVGTQQAASYWEIEE